MLPNRFKRGLKALALSSFAVLASAIAVAGPLELPGTSVPKLHTSDGYIVPNEEYPGRLTPTLTGAPNGAYVSVGTERGFIGAALTPNADRLILIDIDSHVYLYNRTNALLLKAAGPDRRNYLSLRLEPTLARWRDAAERSGLSEVETTFLLSQFESWNYEVSHLKRFRTFHTHPIALEDKFAKANYLYDDTMYAKLYALAASGRIDVGLLNLSDQSAIADLVSQMRAQGIGLSVLDLSNAWWKDYVPREMLIQTLQQFETIAKNESRLVLTGYTFFGISSPEFQYHVSTFQHMKERRGFKQFFSELSWVHHWRMAGYTYFNGEPVTSRVLGCDEALTAANKHLVLHRGMK